MRYICKRAMPFNGTDYDAGQLIAECDLVPDRVPKLIRAGVIAEAGELPVVNLPEIDPQLPHEEVNPEGASADKGDGEQPEAEQTPPKGDGEQPEAEKKKGGQGRGS